MSDLTCDRWHYERAVARGESRQSDGHILSEPVWHKRIGVQQGNECSKKLIEAGMDYHLNYYYIYIFLSKLISTNNTHS